MKPPQGEWQAVQGSLQGWARQGARRAVIILRCTDMPQWSGHYGAKTAKPWLSFGPLPSQ